jgi:SNARE associated Golgi protein.
MENWILDIMAQYGYLGVFFLICIENIFPPIPSEVILTFGGFLTTYTPLSVSGVIAAATVGSVSGAVLLYGLGRLLDVNRLMGIVDRWGHLIRVKHEDIERADRWFQRYGFWTVFFCRMVPLVRSLISIPAGMAGMNFPLFLLFTLLGTLIWNTVLVGLGAMVGDNWTEIVQYMDIYSNFVYAGLAIAGLVVIIYFLRRFWSPDEPEK